MGRIELRKGFFEEKEKVFYREGEFVVSLFRYDTGVEAVRLQNSRGYIVVLPFHGQMIWDAVFDGKSLKMETKVEKPRQAESFLRTYGCYLLYGGPRRICLGEGETGPLHGELPYAPYDRAWLTLPGGEPFRGRDIEAPEIGGAAEAASSGASQHCAGAAGAARFVEIGGCYEYYEHRGDHYEAEPCCRLEAGSALLQVSMKITNRSGYPMDYMGLFHINSPARDGARLVQPCRFRKGDVTLMCPVSGEGLTAEAERRRLAFEEDPASLNVIEAGGLYEPEFCIGMDRLLPDGKGLLHFLQIGPGGGADYVCMPKDGVLHRFARWLSRTRDYNALCLCTPSSAGIGGHDAEKALGNVPQIPPGQAFTAGARIGWLTPAEAAGVEKQIEKLLGEGDMPEQDG